VATPASKKQPAASPGPARPAAGPKPSKGRRRAR
jgi:hypothetical protein